MSTYYVLTVCASCCLAVYWLVFGSVLPVCVRLLLRADWVHQMTTVCLLGAPGNNLDPTATLCSP